jgi:hypothetical protein
MLPSPTLSRPFDPFWPRPIKFSSTNDSLEAFPTMSVSGADPGDDGHPSHKEIKIAQNTTSEPTASQAWFMP